MSEGRAEELSLTSSSFEEGYRRAKAAALAKRSSQRLIDGSSEAREASTNRSLHHQRDGRGPLVRHSSPPTLSSSSSLRRVAPGSEILSSSAGMNPTAEMLLGGTMGSSPHFLLSGGGERMGASSHASRGHREGPLHPNRRPPPSPPLSFISHRHPSFSTTSQSAEPQRRHRSPSTLRGLLQGRDDDKEGEEEKTLASSLESTSWGLDAQGPRHRSHQHQHHHHHNQHHVGAPRHHSQQRNQSPSRSGHDSEEYSSQGPLLATSLLSAPGVVRGLEEAPTPLRLIPLPPSPSIYRNTRLYDDDDDDEEKDQEEDRRRMVDAAAADSIAWLLSGTPEERERRVAMHVAERCVGALLGLRGRQLKSMCFGLWRMWRVRACRRRRWVLQRSSTRREKVLMLSLGSWRVVSVEMRRRRRAEEMLVGACEARRCQGLSSSAFKAWRDAVHMAKRLAVIMQRVGVRWDLVGWAVEEWRRVAVSRREMLRRVGRIFGMINEDAKVSFFHRWCAHTKMAKIARKLTGKCQEAGRRRIETIGLLFFQELRELCVRSKRVEMARRALGMRRSDYVAQVFISQLKALSQGSRMVAKHRGRLMAFAAERAVRAFITLLRARCLWARRVDKHRKKLEVMCTTRIGRMFITALRFEVIWTRRVTWSGLRQMVLHAESRILSSHFQEFASLVKSKRRMARAALKVERVLSVGIMREVVGEWASTASIKMRVRRRMSRLMTRHTGVGLGSVFVGWVGATKRSRMRNISTIRSKLKLTRGMRLSAVRHWRGYTTWRQLSREQALTIRRKTRRRTITSKAFYAFAAEMERARMIKILCLRVLRRDGSALVVSCFDALAEHSKRLKSARELTEAWMEKAVGLLLRDSFGGWRNYTERALSVLRGLEMSRVTRRSWVLSTVGLWYSSDHLSRGERAVQGRAIAEGVIRVWFRLSKRKIEWRKAVLEAWMRRWMGTLSSVVGLWRGVCTREKNAAEFFAERVASRWFLAWQLGVRRQWTGRRIEERAGRMAEMHGKSLMEAVLHLWKEESARMVFHLKKTILVLGESNRVATAGSFQEWRVLAKKKGVLKRKAAALVGRFLQRDDRRAFSAWCTHVKTARGFEKLLKKKGGLRVKMLCFRPFHTWRAARDRSESLRRGASSLDSWRRNGLLLSCFSSMIIHASVEGRARRFARRCEGRVARRMVQAAMRLWSSLSLSSRCTAVGFAHALRLHQSSAVASAKAPSGRAEGWRGQSRLGLGCLALSSSRLLRRAVVQTESMMMVHAAFLEWNSAAKSIRAERSKEGRIRRRREMGLCAWCLSRLEAYSERKRRRRRALTRTRTRTGSAVSFATSISLPPSSHSDVSGAGRSRAAGHQGMLQGAAEFRLAAKALSGWKGVAVSSSEIAAMSGEMSLTSRRRSTITVTVGDWYERSSSPSMMSRGEGIARARAVLRCAIHEWMAAAERGRVARRAVETCGSARRVRLLSSALDALSLKCCQGLGAKRAERRVAMRIGKYTFGAWREILAVRRAARITVSRSVLKRDRCALVTAARKWLQATYNERKLKAASRLTASRWTRSVLVAYAHHWLEMTWRGKKYKAASCVASQRRDRACLEMVLSLWIGTTYWMRRYESASARLIAKTCSACLSIHFGEWRAAAKFEIGLRSAIDVRLARRRGHVLDAWAHVTVCDKTRSVASARIVSSRERGWAAKLFRAWALHSGRARWLRKLDDDAAARKRLSSVASALGVLSRASAEACHRNRMANHSWTRARMSIIRKAFSGLVSACDGSRRLRVTGARLRAMWLRGLAASTLQLMREAAQTGRGLASVRRAIAKGRVRSVCSAAFDSMHSAACNRGRIRRIGAAIALWVSKRLSGKVLRCWSHAAAASRLDSIHFKSRDRAREMRMAGRAMGGWAGVWMSKRGREARERIVGARCKRMLLISTLGAWADRCSAARCIARASLRNVRTCSRGCIHNWHKLAREKARRRRIGERARNGWARRVVRGWAAACRHQVLMHQRDQLSALVTRTSMW